MKWLESRILWGVLLIMGGVLFLLQNLGLIEFAGIFWAILLSLAGIFFLSIYLANRLNWWAILPGVGLLSLAIASAVGYIFPALAETWSGIIALGGIGLSFLAVYLLDRQRWWAIIPMGVMFSLCFALGLTNYLPSSATGGLFLIGLGITFALVALLPGKKDQMNWSWIPAGILTVLGIVLSATAGKLFNYLIAALLILVGVIIIYFSNRSNKFSQ